MGLGRQMVSVDVVVSDIGGGRFFKDVALNFIMIYTYVFLFRGRGCRSLVRIL